MTNMERIILIETSTALCSAAICEDGAIKSYRESSAPKAHASLTAVFIKEMLDEINLEMSDIDAVCVSMGPGSYTGLRVGVSTAKGLCFGAGKPMLAVGTLDILVEQARLEQTITANDAQGNEITRHFDDFKYIVPMIDARRMEVYSAVYNSQGRVSETQPVIVDENSFIELLSEGPVLFIGDGAGKCAGVIKHPDAAFLQCFPKASSMGKPATEEFHSKNFRDVAYFEPFYLKEFVATTSKKKLF